VEGRGPHDHKGRRRHWDHCQGWRVVWVSLSLHLRLLLLPWCCSFVVVCFVAVRVAWLCRVFCFVLFRVRGRDVDVWRTGGHGACARPDRLVGSRRATHDKHKHTLDQQRANPMNMLITQPTPLAVGANMAAPSNPSK
jgi:hypothetical protein